MKITPLAERFTRQGAALSDYRGSRTRADGGSWPAEQPLLYDCSWRAVLAVEGSEARKWLNGMITANVRDLAPGELAASFQLDPKGHILASLDVVCTAPDNFLLLTDESQRQGLLERLRRFVFVSKLGIEDRSEAWSALRLRGLPPQAVTLAEGAWAGSSTPGGRSQWEYVAPAAAIVALWDQLAAQVQPAGSDCQERDRILSRIPRYGSDISEAELPQETGQYHHLSFTKGCYIGQEIVERIRARGAVHRHFTAFRFRAAVEAGAAVTVDGQSVGKLTSVAAEGGNWWALGYLRDPHVQPGLPVTAAGAAGQVAEGTAAS